MDMPLVMLFLIAFALGYMVGGLVEGSD